MALRPVDQAQTDLERVPDQTAHRHAPERREIPFELEREAQHLEPLAPAGVAEVLDTGALARRARDRVGVERRDLDADPAQACARDVHSAQHARVEASIAERVRRSY